MNKYSKQGWLWTEIAEQQWAQHEKESRKYGVQLMQDGLPRETVPKSWVEKGYVRTIAGN